MNFNEQNTVDYNTSYNQSQDNEFSNRTYNTENNALNNRTFDPRSKERNHSPLANGNKLGNRKLYNLTELIFRFKWNS